MKKEHILELIKNHIAVNGQPQYDDSNDKIEHLIRSKKVAKIEEKPSLSKFAKLHDKLGIKSLTNDENHDTMEDGEDHSEVSSKLKMLIAKLKG